MADVLDERSISLAGAQRVLAAALALAEKMDIQVSVAVAGRAGDRKAFLSAPSRYPVEAARRTMRSRKRPPERLRPERGSSGRAARARPASTGRWPPCRRAPGRRPARRAG